MTSKIEDELYIGDSLSKYIIDSSDQFSHCWGRLSKTCRERK